MQTFIHLFVIILTLLQLILINATYKNDSLNNKNIVNEFNYLIMGGERSIYMPRVRAMVSIRSIKEKEFFGDNHICSGAIISISLVLTAAHCVVE